MTASDAARTRPVPGFSRVFWIPVGAASVSLWLALAWIEWWPAPRRLWGDENLYATAAQRIATGLPADIDLLWPAFYAHVLAPFARLGPLAGEAAGAGRLAVAIAQLGLLLVAAASLRGIVRRLAGSARAGDAAGALLLLDPQIAAFGFYLWPELLHLACALAALWLLVAHGARRLALVAAGALFGAALLAKSVLLPFLPLLAVAIAADTRLREGIARAGLVAVVAAAVVAPTVLENGRLHGAYTIADSSRFNLWVGLNDRSRRDLVDRSAAQAYALWRASGPDFATRDARIGERIAELVHERGVLAVIAQQLSRQYFRLFDKDSFLTNQLPGGAVHTHGYGYAGAPPLLAAILRAWSYAWHALVLSLACTGLAIAISSAARGAFGPRPAWVAVAMAWIGYTLVLFLGLHVKSRYRVQLWPALAGFAGAAVAFFAARFAVAAEPRWSAPGPVARAGASLAVLLLWFLAFGGALLGCGRAAPAPPPNVLLVVWDTVRADHLSLYGHDRPTTPRLDALARDARVFDDCISVASTTVPAHASIFTGLLPAEHGVANQGPRLDDSFTTLAETLREAGYRTYLFSENPHLREKTGLTQGFDLAEHPWSPAHREQATAIVRAKLDRDDRSHELAWKLAVRPDEPHNLIAAAPLPATAFLHWLDRDRDRERPYFAVLNFMEAHQPLIPSRTARTALMTPEQIAASYRVDRRWNSLWDYTFGLREYSAEEIALTRLTYDAALRELDGAFGDLFDALRARGDLEDTIVVLVGDHGEHLGEHHLLDHQFSVYEPLLRVPLVLWYPKRVPAGRERAPVTNMDLYPTLLELAGLPVPTVSTAQSLLAPAPDRARIGAYQGVLQAPLAEARRRHPGFDPAPFERTLQAFYRGTWKLIVGSDGSRRLYDLASDPGEQSDLAERRPDVAGSLAKDLSGLLAATRKPPAPRGAVELDAATRERLKGLGYAD